MLDHRPPWKKGADRARLLLLAVIGVFIVWTSLVPRPATGWDGPELLPRRVPTSLPLPTLLLILVVVAVIALMNRRRLL